MQPVLFFLFMCATCVYADFATDFDLLEFLDEDETELEVAAETNNTYNRSYITQPRDHFDQTDDHTFEQFYIYYDEFFANKTSPVLMLSISYGGPKLGLYPTMIEIAREHKAKMFVLRHRYYYESNVTSDLSVENMKYLSSRQSLADMATFIVQTNKNYHNPRWIVYGCSYPGNLAAWFRQEYPHLTVGAVAFSAPVEAKLDFWEYNEVAKVALKHVNSTCAEDFNTAMDEIMSQNMTEKELAQNLGLCSPIQYDSIDFTSLLVYIYYVGMFNQKFYKEKFEVFCAGFHTPLSGVRNLLVGPNSTCFEVAEFRNILLEQRTNISTENASARSWAYQKCTEFGYFKTIPGYSIRSAIDFFCSKVFGSKFNEETVRKSVEVTNGDYGGKAISDTITNTVFVNEEFDPWGNLSVGLQMKDKASKSIVMRDAGHCAGSGRNNSSPDRNSTIDTITQYVGMWLQQAKPTTTTASTSTPSTSTASTSTPSTSTPSTSTPSTSTPAASTTPSNHPLGFHFLFWIIVSSFLF